MGFKRAILDGAIAMGYRFNRQVSIEVFPPYYFIVHCELELLASTWCDVVVVVNFDDFKVCLLAFEQ